MKKISAKLARFVVESGCASEQDFDLYQYGFQMGIEVVICFIASMGIAIYQNMLLEFTIFSIIFIPLRTFVGGLHMDSFVGCFLCSAVVQMLSLYFIKNCQIPISYAWLIIIACSGLILRIMPIKTNEEEIEETEKQYYRKMAQRIMLCILLFACLSSINKAVNSMSLIAITLLIVLCSQGLGIIKYKIATPKPL